MSFKLLIADDRIDDAGDELFGLADMLRAAWILCWGCLVACLVYAHPVAADTLAVPKYNLNRSEPIQVWRSIVTGAPSAREEHTAVWTGSEMMVWGGWDGYVFRDDGVRYKLVTDSWKPLPGAGAPSARILHSMVWTGSLVIVWGGGDFEGRPLGNGARLDPYHVIYVPYCSK